MMASSKFLKFKCLEITQPIGVFYIGAIDSKDLLNISYADIRRVEAEQERDVEIYLGIQRPLSKSRVKEIGKYVNLIDAAFPTSVILAIKAEDVKFDSKTSTMEIRNDENVAKIIDGQHRIAGLRNFQNQKFMLNVTIFVDMDIEDQAMVFATINLKHTKVSKSLAYDLFDFTKTRSPQKTCHNIVKLLNTKKESPFEDKIKILGTATGKPSETLTQATVVESLLKYTSSDAMKDRDLIKRGKKPKRADEKEAERLIFRNLFLDEKDAEIATYVWNYFAAIKKKWRTAWTENRKGHVLNRSTGFRALMRLYRHLYLDNKRTAAEIQQALNMMNFNNDSFDSVTYVPGASGERQLYVDMCNFLDYKP